MATETKQPGHDQPQQPQQPGTEDQARFKREGPTPGSGDTGGTVEEMNEAARRSIISNIRPVTGND